MWSIATIAAIASACGARSPLDGASADQDVTDDGGASHANDGAAGGLDGGDDAVCRGVRCDDGVACTRDACADAGCTHAPDDSRCPAGFTCDGKKCTATVYVVATRLYKLEMTTFAIEPFGSSFLPTTNLALGPDGRLYGLGGSNLVYIDRTTGDAISGPRLASDLGEANALVGSSGDVLYAGSGQELRSVDRYTAESHRVAAFPDPYRSSGDLAFVGATLFGVGTTGAGQGDDSLVAFDLSTGTSRLVGTTGMHCMYGLVAIGATLYGFTCNGDVTTIDVATGRATKIAHVPLSINDAAF